MKTKDQTQTSDSSNTRPFNPMTIPHSVSGIHAQLPVGCKVKVNCFHATVREVITSLHSYDPFGGRDCAVELQHPLYELEIDYSRRYSSVDERKRVPLDRQRTRVRLFADEFEVVPAYQYHRCA
jgi:hypothetical protein